MNYLSNFSKHFAIPAAFVLAVNFNAKAQSPVESTHVDEKYAYTTVVYKTTAATDKDVLSALENDFSIGDVVRVTLAPPPAPPAPPAPISAIAASEPVYADKNKGEDNWLPAATKPAPPTLTVSAVAPVVAAPKTAVKNMEASPKPIPVGAKAVTLKPTVVAKTVATQLPTEAPKLAPVPVQNQKTEIVSAPVASKSTSVKAKSSTSGKSVKAHKSVKKSGKKSGHKMKLKNRKHGKQGYGCPKF
ncbi:MAG: hypothetical protein ACKVUS_00675 [Saprospiraceae bacterium]